MVNGFIFILFSGLRGSGDLLGLRSRDLPRGDTDRRAGLRLGDVRPGEAERERDLRSRDLPRDSDRCLGRRLGDAERECDLLRRRRSAACTAIAQRAHSLVGSVLAREAVCVRASSVQTRPQHAHARRARAARRTRRGGERERDLDGEEERRRLWELRETRGRDRDRDALLAAPMHTYLRVRNTCRGRQSGLKQARKVQDKKLQGLKANDLRRRSRDRRSLYLSRLSVSRSLSR